MSEPTDRLDAPIEMRFIDLFMIIIAALLFIILTLGITAIRTEGPPRILTDSLPQAILNENYSLTLARTGGKGPFTWRVVEGALPRGLRLREDYIEGTPETMGEWSVTIEILDAALRSARSTFTFDVSAISSQSQPLRNQPWVMLPNEVLPDAQGRRHYAFKLQSAGGTPPYRWQLADAPLPAGLRLDSQGNLSGTPEGASRSLFHLLMTQGARRELKWREEGTHHFVVTATDSNQTQVVQPVQLYVKPKPLHPVLRFLLMDFSQPVGTVTRVLSTISYGLIFVLLFVWAMLSLVGLVQIIRAGASPTYYLLAGYPGQQIEGWYGLLHRRNSQADDYADHQQMSPFLVPYAMTVHWVCDPIYEFVKNFLSKRKESSLTRRAKDNSGVESLEMPGHDGTVSPPSLLELIKDILRFLLSLLVFFGRGERPLEIKLGTGRKSASEDEEEEALPPEVNLPRQSASLQSSARKRSKEEDAYLQRLKKGAKVKYGGAFLALPFLQAAEFEDTLNQVFRSLPKVGNGLLHTSLDRFLQEVTGLQGQDSSSGKLDDRFDVILGRKAPPPQVSWFGKRKEEEDPMQIEFALPAKFENNAAAWELSRTMHRSAKHALDWIHDKLPKDRFLDLDPKVLQRLLRKPAYVQLREEVLHVQLWPFERKGRELAEALCEALNAHAPHSFGRYKFPIRFAVGKPSQM